MPASSPSWRPLAARRAPRHPPRPPPARLRRARRLRPPPPRRRRDGGPPARDQPGPNGGAVVRWFVGLGAGGQPQQFAAEQAFVQKFDDEAKDKVYISLEIYNNNVAASLLATQIAAGNAPDIIGPVGVEGLNIFRDQLLDLAPLITKTGFDTSKYDPALVDFFKLGEGGATIGVPFATYPSMLWYNTKLFKEAKLPLPPTKVGDLYEGKPWDMDAVRTLGMKLTVDKNGNDATSADFDAANVVQWGFDMQYADNSPLAEASLFGASSFVADDGKTAQIGDPVRVGEKWFNDGVWKDHFIPNANQINSDLLAKGSEFASGNLAMNETHTWFTCCTAPAAPAKPIVTDFGWAVAPAYNGVTTAKLHADTFSILKTTKHPDEAFAALTAFVNSRSCSPCTAPCRRTRPCSSRSSTRSTSSSRASSSTGTCRRPCWPPGYAQPPAWVPDYAKSRRRGRHSRTSTARPAVDIDAELDTLKTTLQGIYDAAPAVAPSSSPSRAGPAAGRRPSPAIPRTIGAGQVMTSRPRRCP